MKVGVVDQAQTRELRRRVLRPKLAITDQLPGDEVPDAVHVGALDDDGSAVCACIIYPDPCPWLPGRAAWHLRQMATDERRRGAGYGRLVVEAAADQVRSAGAEILWCNARETAAGFYGRLGFAIHGDVFTDAQHPLPHLRMWRELPAENDSWGTPRHIR